MDLTFKQGTDCNEEFYSKEWLVAYIRQYWEKKKKKERNATSSYFENINPEKGES